MLAVPADGLSDDVLLVAVGPFAAMALAVAERLRNQGIGVTVADPRWVLPVPAVLGELAAAHKLVVTLEDNGVHGGVGSAVSAALRRAEIDVPCRDVGLPQEFFEHASRGEVLADVGLTDRHIARQVTGWVAAQGATAADARSASASTSATRRLATRRRVVGTAQGYPADLFEFGLASGLLEVHLCAAAVDLQGGDGVPEERSAGVRPRHG